MKHTITIPDPEHVEQAASEFLKETAGRNFIALYAPMGAGKTTFTSALCRVKGVDGDAVGSPTFAIVNESLIPDDALRVRISVNPDSSRTLSWED